MGIKNADVLKDAKELFDLEKESISEGTYRVISDINFYGDGAIAGISFTYIKK